MQTARESYPSVVAVVLGTIGTGTFFAQTARGADPPELTIRLV
jgi:hypothetical protein